MAGPSYLDFDSTPPYPGQFDRESDGLKGVEIEVPPLLRPIDISVLRSFSELETNLVIQKINVSSRLPRLNFFFESFADLKAPSKKPPFWIVPFVILPGSALMAMVMRRNGAPEGTAAMVAGSRQARGGILLMDENGFHTTAFDGKSLIQLCSSDDVISFDLTYGNALAAGVEYMFEDPDEGIQNTLTLTSTNEETIIVERHGPDCGSGLRVMEAIWERWSGVVEKSRGSSAWIYNALGDCVYFDSWEEVLEWATTDTEESASSDAQEEERDAEDDKRAGEGDDDADALKQPLAASTEEAGGHQSEGKVGFRNLLTEALGASGCVFNSYGSGEHFEIETLSDGTSVNARIDVFEDDLLIHIVHFNYKRSVIRPKKAAATAKKICDLNQTLRAGAFGLWKFDEGYGVGYRQIIDLRRGPDDTAAMAYLLAKALDSSFHVFAGHEEGLHTR